MNLNVIKLISGTYVSGWLFACFIWILYIQFSSTWNGVNTGIYFVTIYTNHFGENYIELILELFNFPMALAFWLAIRKVRLSTGLISVQK